MTLIFLIELIIAAIFIWFIGSLLAKSGIFKSQKNKLEKAARDINDKTRDPVADAEAAIRDAQDSINKLKSIRIDERTRLARQRSLRLVNIENINKWEELARQAGIANNADDVRKCLTHKQAYERNRNELDVEIEKTEKSVENLTAKITDLTTKVTNAADQKNILSLRKQRAEVDAEVIRQQDQINVEALDGAFARLEHDTMNAEAEAIAVAQEAEDGVPADDVLQSKYAAPKQVITDDIVAKYLAKA